MNTTKRNWDIYTTNTGIFSLLSRCTVVTIFISVIVLFKTGNIPLEWARHDFKVIALYFMLDLSQYFVASVMYNIVARLQELKILSGERPVWVNYPAKVCYTIKYGVLIYLLSLFM